MQNFFCATCLLTVLNNIEEIQPVAATSDPWCVEVHSFLSSQNGVTSFSSGEISSCCEWILQHKKQVSESNANFMSDPSPKTHYSKKLRKVRKRKCRTQEHTSEESWDGVLYYPEFGVSIDTLLSRVGMDLIVVD